MKFVVATVFAGFVAANECPAGNCKLEEIDFASALQQRRDTQERRSRTITGAAVEEVEYAADQKLSTKRSNLGPRATTSLGLLKGRKQAQCEEFKGIPFAKPPVGELRFAEPVEWDNPFKASGREAREWGSVCPQWSLNYQTMLPERKGDEDCLFLNVQRPIGAKADSGLPLLVYIHGGGLYLGAASEYDFCGFAGVQGVIVASMNYRLGPLGFASADGFGSNLGIKDQRLALQWLKREATAFGSNPEMITVMGESAGAASVFHHLASPLSAGLFQAAIAMSGYAAIRSGETARSRTIDLATAVDCDTDTRMLSCLRSKSMTDLIDNAGLQALLVDEVLNPSWNPTLDDEDMPTYPQMRFMNGEIHQVPLLIGANTDEGTSSVYTEKYKNGMTESDFTTFYSAVTGSLMISDSDKTALSGLYNGINGTDDFARQEIAADLLGDRVFLCPTLLTARQHSKVADVFLYRFNQRWSYDTNPVPGVYHGSEVVPLLFPVVAGAEQPLADTMQKMWADFAKTQDPAADIDFVNWPQHDATNKTGLVIQMVPEIEQNYKGASCGFMGM